MRGTTAAAAVARTQNPWKLQRLQPGSPPVLLSSASITLMESPAATKCSFRVAAMAVMLAEQQITA